MWDDVRVVSYPQQRFPDFLYHPAYSLFLTASVIILGQDMFTDTKNRVSYYTYWDFRISMVKHSFWAGIYVLWLCKSLRLYHYEAREACSSQAFAHPTCPPPPSSILCFLVALGVGGRGGGVEPQELGFGEGPVIWELAAGLHASVSSTPYGGISGKAPGGWGFFPLIFFSLVKKPHPPGDFRKLTTNNFFWWTAETFRIQKDAV